MRKTVLLALLPAALIATGWGTLEQPAASGDILLAAALGIAVVLLPTRRLRVAGAVGALLATACAGFGLSPFDARPFDRDHDLVGPLLSRIPSGILDYYAFTLPFNPGERARMHGVLLLAVCGFTLAASLAIAARRPLLAAGATFAGAAWPVTLVEGAATPMRGALLLGAALVLLAALRHGVPRGAGQTAAVGAAVIFAALVAVSSPAVAKGGFLAWQHWEPYQRPAKPVTVSYVWDADYDGVNFPRTPTTVLTIEAPRRAPYWRATTLDSFSDDRWKEDAIFVDPIRTEDRDELTGDPLLPARAQDESTWLRHEVTVEALRDTRLVGASVPIAFEEGVATEFYSGTTYTPRLRRGQDYVVWSYVAQPRPRELARSRPNYPDEVFAHLAIGEGVLMPPFGTPDRDRYVRDSLEPAYRPLYRKALEVVGRPRNPYAAVVALEAWFRTSGDFRYDEEPPVSRRAPPLVAFVTGHRRGYCQHFAGAMALMLRYLGIPARVAAGFTTGRFDQDEGRWTVADTNAHAWVEVWFDGYGWLPFDPTPGRGRLRASYTASSLFFDANGATAAFAGVAATALGLEALRSRLDGANGDGSDPLDGRGSEAGGGEGAGAAAGEGRGDLSLVGLLLLLAAGVTAALWLAKFGRRRMRYLTRDPRRIAGAVRADIVEYVLDQGMAVSPSATPAELGAQLHRRTGVYAERLAAALAEARFGPQSEAEAAATAALREGRAVRRALRRRLGPRAKLRGLLSLRSFGLGPV